MVPEALAGRGGRRGARVPPHDKAAMRRARGLEATVVDHSLMRVGALASDDSRAYLVKVASPAALLVAKLHKIGEREDEPHRLESKDAHDVYRLLATLPLDRFVQPLIGLAEHHWRARQPEQRSTTWSDCSQPALTPSDRRWPAEQRNSSATRPSSQPPWRSWPRMCSLPCGTTNPNKRARLPTVVTHERCDQVHVAEVPPPV
jgi:hypothetical protein